MDDSLENRTTRVKRASLLTGMALGDLVLDKLLERGVWGELWRAVDSSRASPSNPGFILLQFLPVELQNSPRELKRVVDTFRAAQSLQHPNISPVYFLRNMNSWGYVIGMKYVDGVNLWDSGI